MVFFVCLCLDKCLKERQIGSAEHTASTELVRPFTTHPHGPGSNPREAVGNAKNFSMGTDTWGPLVIHTTEPPHVPHFSFSPSRPLHIFLSPLLDQRRHRRHLPTTPLFAAGARPPPTPAST